MQEKHLEIWELWYPKAAAAGLPFSRSRIDPQNSVIVHSPPQTLTVEVSNLEGQHIAGGKDLEATTDSPMARLTKEGDRIKREDIWPEDEDLGLIVLLPGGEAGRLLKWWHAEDHSEWRWQVEFYNKK
jgi:hypothetical protein